MVYISGSATNFSLSVRSYRGVALDDLAAAMTESDGGMLVVAGRAEGQGPGLGSLRHLPEAVGQ